MSGLESSGDIRNELPSGWNIQDCDYDTWTMNWTRSRFVCDECCHVFSTMRECMHHAPCNSFLHTRYVPRYVPMAANLESIDRMGEAIVRHIRQHGSRVRSDTDSAMRVMRRRDVFDQLGLSGRYVFQSNFHRAVDDRTTLVRRGGCWMRSVSEY